MQITDLQGFIFDIDGVIFRGDRLIDGAKEALLKIAAKDKKYIFVSNHTIYTKEKYLAKLRNFGLEVLDDQLLTANDGVIAYIKDKTPDQKKVQIIGQGGIFEEFEKAGFEITEENPDWVVSSFDQHLTYEKLFQAATNVRQGAGFIVTSPDRYLPTERGLELGYGSLGATISYATQQDPIYTGKPYPPIINEAAKRLGIVKENLGIVGDTLETDIASKSMAGLGMAILVLSGNSTKEMGEKVTGESGPDLILNSIADIPELL